MSKLKIFGVKDTMAEAYMNPFYARSTGEAIRSFADETNKPDSPFNRHPNDYNLFELGEFDQVTGEMKILAAPHSHGTAQTYKSV